MKIFLAALLIVTVTTEATEDSGKQGSLPADEFQSSNSNLHHTNGTEISPGNNDATSLPSSEVFLPPFPDLFVRAPVPETVPVANAAKMLSANPQSPNFFDDQKPQVDSNLPPNPLIIRFVTRPETVPVAETVKMLPSNPKIPNFFDDQKDQVDGNLPSKTIIIRLVSVPETVPRTDKDKRLIPVPVRRYLPMDVSRPDPVEVDRTVLVYLLETIPQASSQPSPAESRRLGSDNGPYGGMFPTGDSRYHNGNHGRQVNFNRDYANLFRYSDLGAQNNGYHYQTPSKFWSD